MVRTIDGDERRRVLAEAVWRVIRRDGFEAASVRGVAAESGLSTGSVRHFFGTQADLHRFAMEELGRTVTARVTAALEVDRPDPVAAVVGALRELLPHTEVTRAEFLAHLQFLTRAAVDPRLAPVAQASYAAIDELLLGLLTGLRELGLVRADVDLAVTTRRLGVLVDGLFLRMLVAPGTWSAAAADDEIRRFLVALGPSA